MGKNASVVRHSYGGEVSQVQTYRLALLLKPEIDFPFDFAGVYSAEAVVLLRAEDIFKEFRRM